MLCIKVVSIITQPIKDIYATVIVIFNKRVYIIKAQIDKFSFIFAYTSLLDDKNITEYDVRTILKEKDFFFVCEYLISC